MIILQKLKWDNCFSYGTGNEIDLSSDTLTQLVGTNGVGKSSIPLILEEVLFNKNSKNVKKADIANRYVNQGYDISLDFSVDSDSYCISVSRRSTLKCKLTKNGEDISSHTASNTYKSLGEILGIDFKTFSQLVYQNTNASLQFLTATDTNRKKFLIDLLKLDEYVSFFETFKEAVRVASSNITATNAKIATIEKWLEDNFLEDTRLLDKMDLPFQSEEDEKTLSSLQIEFENISEKNKKINTNNHLKEQLKLIDLHENKRLLALHPELIDTSAHLTRLGAWKSESIHEEKQLQKYQALAGMENMECITCGQDIDENFVNTMIKEHQERYDQCIKFADKDREKLQEAEENNEIHRTSNKAIKDWESIYRSIDDKLPTQIINEEELGNTIKEIRQRIASTRESLSKVVEENERRERHNTRIGIIQEQTEQFQEQLSSLESGLQSSEDKLTILEILKKAFSTNGLLAYKIESLVKELEILTNEYLAEFSDGRFSINFVVENDKLNVEVSDNGNIIDILALSSGELARVNIATLVAIRKLMTSISRSQINVLFLDEVNQALDEQGKEKVVEVLLKEENLNTYLVSHGWTHPLLEKIEIIKEDNISCLSS
jgi:DNA repair exonuclease SbcCD ATPase subunit|tara:strand:- start:1172 stop:2989 length:1818 start_codon:yes stop_codon:yes gene_type:complete